MSRHPLEQARRRGGDAAGLWRGTVTRADATTGRPYVEVPRLTPGFEYGPLPYLVDDDAASTGPGGTDAHTHAQEARAWAKGDRVLVGFLEGRNDDLVVLGRLA